MRSTAVQASSRWSRESPHRGPALPRHVYLARTGPVHGTVGELVGEATFVDGVIAREGERKRQKTAGADGEAAAEEPESLEQATTANTAQTVASRMRLQPHESGSASPHGPPLRHPESTPGWRADPASSGVKSVPNWSVDCQPRPRTRLSFALARRAAFKLTTPSSVRWGPY